MEFDREYRKIMEAISLGDAKKHKLSKKHSGAYDEVLDEVFGGKNRIMMPLNIDYSTINNAHLLFLKIDEFLDKHGYSVETLKDYIDGKAVKFKVDSDDTHIYDIKNPVKIGKLLQKYEEDGEIEVTERKDGKKTTKTVVGKPLLHEFKNDPIRATNGEFLIVISRHPYDVAGSSTDRSWTSCMNLGLDGINYPNRRQGVNLGYVTNDISEGTLVAYVVTKNELFKGAGGEDKVKLHKPLSRILIKPHNSDVGKVYTIGMMYGSQYQEFYEKVKEWITDKLNHKAKNADNINAMRNTNLYPDSDKPVGFEMKSISKEIKVLRREAKRISGKFKNANVFIDYDEYEDENFFSVWIHFKYNISKCMNIKEFKMTEKISKQIKTIFDPGDFSIQLRRVDIIDNNFIISFELLDDDFDNPHHGMYKLKEIEEYLEWIKQNVDPEICEIMGELGLTNSVNESFRFNREYQKLLKEFSQQEGSDITDLLKSKYRNRRIILTNGNFQPMDKSIDAQRTHNKPAGSWYSLGEYWAKWMRSEQPDWFASYDKIYMLDLDYSKILRINNGQKMKDFQNKYGEQPYKSYNDFSMMIDWKRVAEDYAGIEIIPMIWENSKNWYRTWDIPSGCIWDSSAIKGWKEIEIEFKDNPIETEENSPLDDTPPEVQNIYKHFSTSSSANEAVKAMDVVHAKYKNDLGNIPNEIIDKIATSPGQSVIFSKMLINAGITKIPQPILDGIKSDEKYVAFFLRKFGNSVSPAYVHFLNNESSQFDNEYRKILSNFK